MQNKVVILNSNNENNFKAILTLNKEGRSNIRFFNLKDRFKSLALGFRQSAKVIKIPLNVNNSLSSFEINDNFDINKSFTCAVVDVSNAFCPEIVLSASENGKKENEHIEGAFMGNKVESTSHLYTSDSQDDIENIIDENLEQDIATTYYDACAKCKYREAFYSEGEAPQCGKLPNDENVNDESIKINDASDEKSKIEIADVKEEVKQPTVEEKLDPLDDDATFYQQIKSQIDALFNKYDRDEKLESIVPDSSWVKVTYDESGGYYVMGLIKNNDEVKYICYGMPSKDSKNPPEDLSSFAQYLPTVEGEGYWVVCQDALDGQTLKIKIVE